MSSIKIVRSSVKYAESYNQTVDAVAQERLYLATVKGFPLDASKQYVRFMEENNFAQYFAIDNGLVAGWCDITPKSIPEFSHAGILGMGLLSEYRGNGLGKKLLEKTIYHAKSIQNLESIELVVFESNENAIQLYRSFGFEIEGTKQKARKIDGKYDNEILMRLFI